MVDWNLANFLSLCEKSGQQTYDLFKSLLTSLETPQQFTAARMFLHELFTYWREQTPTPYLPALDQAFLQKYHFSFSTLKLDEFNQFSSTIDLLQFPSTFTPEEWSFTFYEGLARYPIGEFQDKTVCELGCGNGWISLALCGRFWPEKIYGFDINPRAIACAKLNYYLNAFAADGSIKKDPENRSLQGRVEFHLSDLLQVCREKNWKLDRIIGCIPQVLGPDPTLMAATRVSENASDEFLYSLSNYCGKQGFIEDQFGLGLVARALEEGVMVLKQSGKIVLNLGGRPGSAILDQLFLRRGFSLQKVWHRKVEQASDTDIVSLVEIERHSPHRFEFFMGPLALESISAGTAYAYQKAGGTIYHSLTVYDAYLRHPGPIQRIMKRLKNSDYQDALRSMDLSFNNPQIGDEKILFLAELADFLGSTTQFPYGPQEGELFLRRSIARFLHFYFRMECDQNSIFIAPTRTHIIKNLLYLYRPKKVLVAKELTRTLPGQWNTQSYSPEILEAPMSTHLLCDLAYALHPDLVVASLTTQEGLLSDAFSRLVDLGEKIKAKVVVDISHAFELSSNPESSASGVFEYLSRHPLPSHVYLLCGLIRNQVYSDMDLSFLISQNPSFPKWWKNLADLTYCRPPLLGQLYYNSLLQELLKFQIPEVRPHVPSLQSSRPSSSPIKAKDSLPLHVRNAFEHSALQSEHLPIDEKTIRLDYGENELPTPALFKGAIMESFIRQNFSASELDPRPEIKALLKARFGLDTHPQEEFIFGHGITPLFSAIMEYLGQRQGRLLMPQGSYGYFSAIAQFFGVQIIPIDTQRENSFKLTPKDLQKVLSSPPLATKATSTTSSEAEKETWLFLNAPVVNPTGAIYSPSEVTDLLGLCNLYRVKVMIDTIFSGLEFSGPAAGNQSWNLEEDLQNLPAQEGGLGGLEFVVLGGISKEFSAGGARFGLAYTRSLAIKDIFQDHLGKGPHSTLMYAIKKIYSHWNQHTPSFLAHLIEQRSLLKERAKQLQEVLSHCGWEILPPQGGLFLVAKPTQYIGKKINLANINGFGQENEVVISAINLPNVLFARTGLLINNPEWTGIPDHCRFVLSVDESSFQKGISALKKFHQEIFS